MRLEDQVCTFEQAKELVELELHLESFWIYKHRDEIRESSNFIRIQREYMWPTYTVAELGVLLPSNITVSSVKYYQDTKKIDLENRFQCFYHKALHDSFGPDGFVPHRDWYQAEAEARAAALIWLIENGYVKVEDLKL